MKGDTADASLCEPGCIYILNFLETQLVEEEQVQGWQNSSTIYVKELFPVVIFCTNTQVKINICFRLTDFDYVVD